MREAFVKLVEQQAQESARFLVIMGMAKSGTTLPLTLLDGHPQLCVFPEELRFFHLSCDDPDAQLATEALLGNANIQQLKNRFNQYTEYQQHGGTGFGKRDYSNIDYQLFHQAIQWIYQGTDIAYLRYLGTFLALELARHGDLSAIDTSRIFVSKAPHNELYLSRWQRMLGNKGKYLFMLRSPFELRLSLKKIDDLTNTQSLPVENFVKGYEGRLKLLKLSNLSDSQLYILKYENLIDNPEMVMRQIAEFLQIEFQAGLLHPTKNNIDWDGNSIRGLSENKIFNNPERARLELDKEEYNYIERNLQEIIEQYKYKSAS